jgi:Mg-chelatase subunit ChlD
MKVVLEHVLIALTFLGALGSTSLRAQDQAPIDRSQQTIRSSLDLVSIQASVRDKRGRPLNSLTTADFEIRDNGSLKPILSMRSDRRSPVSLAILVDMSGSMSVGRKIAMARQAFYTLLSQLRDGEDEIALFTFDAAIHERHTFTTNLARLKGALDDFQPFGTTSLYDATATTARRLAERSATHKAIIVLTDGIDTSSTLTAPEVSGLASSIDVPVYIVPRSGRAAGRGRTISNIGGRRPAGSGGVDGRPGGVCEQLRGNRCGGVEPARRAPAAIRPRHRGRKHQRVASAGGSREASVGHRQSEKRLLRRLGTTS